jgi:hypothetical protein
MWKKLQRKQKPNLRHYQQFSHVFQIQQEMGHALKKRKPFNHLNLKQKQFIYSAYMQGEETGRKISAENLSQVFKTTLDCHGNQLFHPTEYLTKQQVLTRLSRLASNRKNNQVSNYLKSNKNSFDADEEAYNLDEATEEDKFVETHNALVNMYNEIE